MNFTGQEEGKISEVEYPAKTRSVCLKIEQQDFDVILMLTNYIRQELTENFDDESFCGIVSKQIDLFTN